MEKLYKELVPEKEVIGIIDIFGSFIDSISGLVEGIGGIGPVINMTLGLLATKLMPQIISGTQSIFSNLLLWNGTIEKTNMEFVKEAQILMKEKEILNEHNVYYE